MDYPKTGNETYVSFSISNTMLEGLGKSTITREPVSADYLKELFAKYGVIVSIKPEQQPLLRRVNELYGLNLEIPESLTAMGLRRKSGTLLPSYTDEELEEATFGFDKFYVQSVHYDDLVKENETLRKNLDAEIAWRTRDD